MIIWENNIETRGSKNGTLLLLQLAVEWTQSSAWTLKLSNQPARDK